MKVTLEQITQYYDEESNDQIQIVLGNAEWDDAYELPVNSELLKPFLNYIVTDMRCEESYLNKKPVLRVALEKGENHDRLEKKADESEILGGCLRVCGDAGHRFWRHEGNGCADYRYHYGWCGCAGLHYRRRAC